MRTHDRYKWVLSGTLLDEPLFSQEVHPQYDSLSLKHTKQDSSVYYVPSFESRLSFVEKEFELIYNCGIKTKFTLQLIDRFGTFSTKEMTFMRTNCEIDVNHQIISVTPTLFNPYKKLIDKKDEEYSVVDMGLDKKALNFYLNAQLQIYAQEDSVISLISLYGKGNQHTVAPQHNHYALTRGEYTNQLPLRIRNAITGPGMNFSGAPVIAAVLVGTGSDNRFVGTFTAIASIADFMQAHIDGRVVYYGNGSNYSNSEPVGDYVLMNRIGGNAAVTFGLAGPYTANWYQMNNPYQDWSHIAIVRTFAGQTEGTVVSSEDIYINEAYSLTSGSFQTNNGTVNFTCRVYIMYGGFVTGHKVSTNLGPFPTGEEVIDVTADFNHNYKTRYPIGTNAFYTPREFSRRFIFSHRTTETPTNYGRVANTNLYYTTPDDNNVYLPIKKDSWFEGHSFWLLVRDSELDYDFFSYNNTPTTNPYTLVQYPALRLQNTVADFYKLYDVIHGLLAKIDPSIVFLEDEEHSRFLFSQINPVPLSDGITLVSQLPKYVTQKSNVLKLDYDYPAWKAPLKWAQLEELLRNAFNCYIELFFSENDAMWHLRIEHIMYFLNGHTYSSESGRLDIVDLTHLYDGFNRKELSFKTNFWKYDTGSQADRYEFGWMDKQTEVFDGKPLVVTPEYSLFEDARKEDYKVSWFDTDLDFAISVTSEISSDGFMLVSAQSNDFVEFIAPDIRETNPGMQNYSLSFEYLIPRFHVYDKYAEKVKIENTDTYLDVKLRRRMRIAEDVEFKVPANYEIQPNALINTEVGFGEIETITVDLTSNSCTATLRYELL